MSPADASRANRLARASSPYLLQHATNPVDWHEWGDEAFAAARERDVPIFLSIGYSTCYWCHVMERESFEHEPTARLMNERFVCIKVDREERPDVDDLYMTATQALTGQGGWPMSAFLEPARLRPYWCGTYYPPEPRTGMPSFRQVLEGMSEAWRTRRDDVLVQAEQIADAVTAQRSERQRPVPVGTPQVVQAVETLLRMYDRNHGGFGGAPKFPQPVFAELLLDVRDAADDATRAAVDGALTRTLDRMMIGGIHDHAGGGFHRYAVDAHWTIPHFEKVLYDNAQLLSLYARAASAFGDEEYARVVRRTAGFLLREMTDGAEPGSRGFYSALDAEVDGREGLNYLWTPDEIRAELNEADAGFALDFFGLSAGTNFKDPHHKDEPARNVLRLEDRLDRLAQRRSGSPAAFRERVDQISDALLRVRDERERPHLDDKVIVAWNGLVIAGLSDAYTLDRVPAWIDAARHAAAFILERLRTPDGLVRTWRNGHASTPAFLEDYAFLARGLLALHRAAPEDHRWLSEAADLADEAFDRFGDGEGGLYDVRAGADDLFARPRTVHDGATPAGASVMLRVTVDLAVATGERRHAERAAGLLASLSAAVEASPIGAAESVRAVFAMMRERGIFADLVDFDAAESRAAEKQRAGADRPGPEFTPVEVYADTDRVAVAADRPASFDVELRIAEGYHVVAADPGDAPPGVVPFRVGLVSGEGVAVYADYPDGEPYGEGGELRVYTGTVSLTVALERSPGVGAGPGRPILGVTFQPCTDSECLERRTLELSVAVDLE